MIGFTLLVGGTDYRHFSMLWDQPQQGRNMNMADLMLWAEFDPIWANRGKAIEGYAEYENALCGLFAVLSDMTTSTATVVFYKIINTSARLSILKKLLHKKFATKFNAFWTPLSKEAQNLDLKRNEIAHWVAAINTNFTPDNKILMGITLIPPAHLGAKQSPEHLTSSDLVDYRKKCDDISGTINAFSTRLAPPKEGEEKDEPSPDRYQQPFVYPLPEDSQSPLRRAEPEFHPQSFPPPLRLLRPNPNGQGCGVWPAREWDDTQFQAAMSIPRSE